MKTILFNNGKSTIVNTAGMLHKRGGSGVDIHYASENGAVVSVTLGVAASSPFGEFSVSSSRLERLKPHVTFR